MIPRFSSRSDNPPSTRRAAVVIPAPVRETAVRAAAIGERLIDAYVDWRQHAAAVWKAHERWMSASPPEWPTAYASYCIALDLEEIAGERYHRLVSAARRA